jgi:hypothetical protein
LVLAETAVAHRQTAETLFLVQLHPQEVVPEGFLRLLARQAVLAAAAFLVLHRALAAVVLPGKEIVGVLVLRVLLLLLVAVVVLVRPVAMGRLLAEVMGGLDFAQPSRVPDSSMQAAAAVRQIPILALFRVLVGVVGVETGQITLSKLFLRRVLPTLVAAGVVWGQRGVHLLPTAVQALSSSVTQQQHPLL